MNHHFPRPRRPRIQWFILAGDVVGAVCLVALVVGLLWLTPVMDALLIGMEP